MKFNRLLALVVMLLGLVALVFGGIFIGEGIAKNNLIVGRMKIENVTLTINEVATEINNSAEAQAAADVIASHRRAIAPTYQELGRFDPTNPDHLRYAQAMNLENYLYLAVTAFGLIQVTMAAGVFMVVTGLALGGGGWVLYRMSRAA
jgi:hypothetical protein